MNVARAWRHLVSTHREAHRLFAPDAMQRLQSAITAGEATHRGEVRLIVESALPLRKIARGMSTRQRAIDAFGTYRVWDTEENNGVLLYLNIADRRIEIVADRAAARAIDDAAWAAIAADARAAFAAGAFERGIADALGAMHRLLAGAFPSDGAPRRNELDDAPVVR